MKPGFIQPPYPRVNAHRGLSSVCPENTLPAFAAAVALGADEIELDLWASRDGELVVCHDAALDRTTDGHGPISAWDWADICRLDAGRWFGAEWSGVPPCRFDDVLDLCGGRVVLNIHIKEPGQDGTVVRQTRDRLLACGLADSACIRALPSFKGDAVIRKQRGTPGGHLHYGRMNPFNRGGNLVTMGPGNSL